MCQGCDTGCLPCVARFPGGTVAHQGAAVPDDSAPLYLPGPAPPWRQSSLHACLACGTVKDCNLPCGHTCKA